MKRFKMIGLLCSVVLIGMLSTVALGQAAPGGGGNGGGNGGGGGGGRGNFDPAQMRQRMEDRLKQQMNATDDEWKVIQPKLDVVLEKQRDAGGGMFGMMGGRGGRGGRGGGQGGPGGDAAGGAAPADNTPQTPTAQAAKALRDTLADTNASADDIKAKLQAFRDAKAKAKEELAAAQKDLQSVLTQRQEAVLVVNGLLD